MQTIITTHSIIQAKYILITNNSVACVCALIVLSHDGVKYGTDIVDVRCIHYFCSYIACTVLSYINSMSKTVYRDTTKPVNTSKSHTFVLWSSYNKCFYM